MGFTYGKTGVKLIGDSGDAIGLPTTTFGSLRVESLVPTAQGDFIYGINNLVFDEIKYAGGGCTVQDGVLIVSSSTSTSGSAAVQLRRTLRYRPGQGSLFRGTCLFNTGVAGNIQLIGVGNGEAGYYFGYLQSAFGILHQPTSRREIRKLDVTTGAGTGNVTVTLDGDSQVVAVVGGSDETQTAYQLAQADYTQLGNGWITDVVSSSVYFLSARAEPLGGSYSVAGSSIAGTFSQVQEGVAPASTFIPQSSWNVDPLDGTGPSGMILDPQKGNVYQIGFQYLGFGNAFFGIENEDTGRIETVHNIKHANNRTTPVLSNPNVHGLVTSTNFFIGSDTGIDVPTKAASLATFNEGQVTRLDPKFSFSETVTIPDTGGSWAPLIAFKANSVFRNRASFGEIELLRISATNDAPSSTPKNFRIAFFVDSTITGDVDFQYVDEERSVVSYALLDASAQTITPETGAIFSMGVGSGGTTTQDLIPLNFVFEPGSVIVIACNRDGVGDTGAITLNWYEKQ